MRSAEHGMQKPSSWAVNADKQQFVSKMQKIVTARRKLEKPHSDFITITGARSTIMLQTLEAKMPKEKFYRKLPR